MGVAMGRVDVEFFSHAPKIFSRIMPFMNPTQCHIEKLKTYIFRIMGMATVMTEGFLT